MKAMNRLILLAILTVQISCDAGTEDRGPLVLDSDRERATTRVPAEWEPQESVWIQWPQDHEASYRASFVKIVDIVQRYQPMDIIVASKALETSAKGSLSAAGVSLENVRFHRAPYDSFWIRDNGPVYVVDADALWIQDWGFDAYGAGPWDDVSFDRDDEIPAFLSGILSAEYEDLNGYILERGNLEANGADTVALNWDCQSARNPKMSRQETEDLLEDTLGATRVLWVEGNDPLDITTGHIDGLLRFVDEDTVVIAERTDAGDALFKGEAAMLQSAVSAAEALGIKVVRMPMPGDVIHGGELLPVIYMNYLVGNGFVLGMAFGEPEWDDDAKARLEEIYPGRDVHMIEVNDLWASGGGVHCVTNDAPRF